MTILSHDCDAIASYKYSIIFLLCPDMSAGKTLKTRYIRLHARDISHSISIKQPLFLGESPISTEFSHHYSIFFQESMEISTSNLFVWGDHSPIQSLGVGQLQAVSRVASVSKGPGPCGPNSPSQQGSSEWARSMGHVDMICPPGIIHSWLGNPRTNLGFQSENHLQRGYFPWPWLISGGCKWRFLGRISSIHGPSSSQPFDYQRVSWRIMMYHATYHHNMGIWMF